MTTEEKAKAYEMALEAARKELGVDRKEWEVVQRVLHNIFPELRENEDERIRKWLVDYFGKVGGKAWIHREFTCEQILSWLEKQKELTPADGWDYADKRMSHPLYLEGFETGRAVERVVSDQEWSEEDKKKIHFLSRLIEFQVKDDEYCFGEGFRMISKQEAIEMLKSLRPQPKQEWDEEDERILKGIIGKIGHDQSYGVSKDDMLMLLKSIPSRILYARNL